MLLPPSQRPNVRHHKENIEVKPEVFKMGKKGKKTADYDEILKEQQHVSSTIAGPSSSPINNQGFFSRSLSRISGRRKRQKRKAAAENSQDDSQRRAKVGTQIPHHEWSSTNDRNLTELTHLDEVRRKKHFLTRGMDRLRRSIRRSLRRGGGQAGQALTSSTTEGFPSSSTNTQAIGNGQTGAGGTSNKSYCHSDEVAVRSAACSFPVKYLGACEVFESRGMIVCESALHHLRTRKRAVKALLYVSGDGIRVVDQDNNRGLIVDQTIEKVSFCSPDRQNDKGFAYICRDGATRRWICHGFHATKESGERLSHAVGCAFTVCLERKRKRDAESVAYKDARAFEKSLNSPKNQKSTNIYQSGSAQTDQSSLSRTNQGYRSFRHLSISERRLDPQKAILIEQETIKPCNSSLNVSTIGLSKNLGFTSTPRPSGNPSLFERSRSINFSLSTSSFPAFNSLPTVPGSKPFNTISQPIIGVSKSRTFLPRKSLFNEPIWEGDDDPQNSLGIEHNSIDNISPGNWNSRFYQTMPHSMPNFVQGSLNNLPPSTNSMIPPPIIYEEGKQQNQSLLHQSTVPMQTQPHKNFEEDNRGSGNSGSPPADPFTTTSNNQQLQELPPMSLKAEDWLEQHFRRAATLSCSSSSLTCDSLPHSIVLPRSATMDWMPHPSKPVNDFQQPVKNWTQFPQQQSQKSENWLNITKDKNDTSFLPLQPLPSPSSFAKTSSWTLTNQEPNVNSLPIPAFPSYIKQKTSITPQPPSSLNSNKSNARDESLTTIKTHTRKASSGRRIEYQLLQETDVSLSPPRNDYSSMFVKEIGGVSDSNTNNKLIAFDPFDVNWSQKVLEETARQHQQNICGTWPRDEPELEKTIS